MDNPLASANKVALVTGAAVRVGREIALTLAKAGCDIVVHYRNSVKQAQEVANEIRAMGQRAECISADLTDSNAIDELFLKVLDRFGRLDILVNSAAVFARTPVGELDEADFDFHINMNLKAPYLCSIAAAKLMHDGGAIINIADVAAERPFKNHVPYCVSKAGLLMLTRGLAKGLAPAIRVNAVSPGTVLFRDDEDEAARNFVISRIPMGDVGTPKDIATAVRFLAIEATYVTGQILAVDGGRSLH